MKVEEKRVSPTYVLTLDEEEMNTLADVLGAASGDSYSLYACLPPEVKAGVRRRRGGR